LLFHTALPVKVIELPSVIVTVPLLSIGRLSMEKKPPLRLEVPLRIVPPVPLNVPFVQINILLTVTAPGPVKVPLTVRFWTWRAALTVTVPPVMLRFWTVEAPAIVRVLKVPTWSTPAPLMVAFCSV
jgi:hypothetical protein